MKLRSAWSPIFGVLVVVIFVCGGIWLVGANPSEDGGLGAGVESPSPWPQPFSYTTGEPASTADPIPARTLQAYLAKLPMGHTVEDIDIDGQVRIDQNGNLVLDPELQRYLDFFIGLTRSPEDEPVMKEALVAAMGLQGIPEEIQAEVLAILEDYLAYRQALEAMLLEGESEAVPIGLEQVFERVYSLRREHLGKDVAEGFFGEEEAALQIVLARKRAMENEALSEAERQQVLDAIEQSWPPEIREIREQAVSVVNVRRQVEALREQGATEEEIFAVRAAQFGVESAERLATLDRERQAWEQRLSTYREQKAQLEARADLSAPERERAIEALRSEHFAEHEVKRVRVLDRL